MFTSSRCWLSVGDVSLSFSRLTPHWPPAATRRLTGDVLQSLHQKLDSACLVSLCASFSVFILHPACRRVSVCDAGWTGSVWLRAVSWRTIGCIHRIVCFGLHWPEVRLFFFSCFCKISFYNKGLEYMTLLTFMLIIRQWTGNNRK